MAHPVWTDTEVNSVARTHITPKNITDYTALAAVGLCKFVFDSITFFKWGTLTEKKVLNRAIFLETVAAVPGMVRGCCYLLLCNPISCGLCGGDIFRTSFSDWWDAASLEIPAEDGSRPRLDPHSSGGGGERTHAFVDIPETEKTRTDLQNFRYLNSGIPRMDDVSFCAIADTTDGRALS